MQKYRKIYLLVLLCMLPSIYACSQSGRKKDTKQKTAAVPAQTVTPINTSAKMKVEIWSDIMCPFCYIGKRHFESALREFADSAQLEIEWKSFQLDPDIPKQTQPVNVYQYLADRKGMSLQQSQKMHQNVVQMAKEAGLTYNFDKTVVANSYNAHRLIQLAKKNKLGDEAEEVLFRSYFTDGADLNNAETLRTLGKSIGLKEEELDTLFASDAYAYEVNQDILEARNIGVTGVPFFVFNRKYAVSGAQPSGAFLDVLKKSFSEWKKDNPSFKMETSEGPSCTPEGACD
jgi:predicted DsbA family dithiol-disulfide isomerase